MPALFPHAAVAFAPALFAPPGHPLRSRRALAAALFASVAPDLDLVLVAALPGGIDWHRGPTHSLLGAAVMGALVGLAARLRGAALWACVAAGFLHPVLDWNVGEPGGPSRYGVPFFWPLSSERTVSPWPIFRPFGIDEPGFLWHMFTPRALAAYAREAVFAAVVLGSAYALGRAARGRPAAGPP